MLCCKCFFRGQYLIFFCYRFYCHRENRERFRIKIPQHIIWHTERFHFTSNIVIVRYFRVFFRSSLPSPISHLTYISLFCIVGVFFFRTLSFIWCVCVCLCTRTHIFGLSNQPIRYNVF